MISDLARFVVITIFSVTSLIVIADVEFKYRKYKAIEELQTKCIADLIDSNIERRNIVLTEEGCEIKQ